MKNEYKVEENKNQITYIGKNRVRGVKFKTPNVIAIQKIPDVNIKTGKVIGTIYSVRSSNLKGSKSWKRFKNKTLAIKYAKSLMIY